MLSAINNLQAQGGTNYDAALINPLAGGLLVTKNGKHKRVIVFLSDGMPNSEPQTTQIISEANKQNVTIYAVTLNMQCPQSLKSISTQTGGQWFENVTTEEQARQIYQQILQTAQGGDPCEIEWQSGITCTAGNTNVELTLLQNGTKANTSYQGQNTSVAKLEFNPTSIKFSDPQVGVKVEQKVTITARNARFTITNITANNGGFDITPKSFVLNSGESRELTVSYIPADSGYNYCKFEIENDKCPTKYYASGGWKGKKPTIRTLKLLQPNGGEVFVAGSDTVITWEGVSPDEPVKLEYRTDDSQPWITVTDTAKGLSYPFKVPKVASKKYLARVTAASQRSSYCDNPDVEICGKIWMGCNLDVDTYRNGDPIRYAETNEDWVDAASKKEGAWCYYNYDPANGEIYGKLYNWYAVNDPRGLAPEGWHIPTDGEWTALENCLISNGYNYDGTTTGNKIAKALASASGWNSSSIAGAIGNTDYPEKRNASGFSALPGGYRGDNGTYGFIGYYGGWWSATEVNDTDAWFRYLRYDSYYGSGIGTFSYSKAYGYSVRCVKD